DHKHFTVSNNNFSTTLQNPYGTDGAGYPVDAEVRVTCGTATERKAFQGSSTPVGTTPSIFASLGQTPCGYGNAAPPEGGQPFPCHTHVKGFNGAGALAATNFYPPYDDTHGSSIAIGDANNDGALDVVTGGGAGSPGAIRTFKLDGTLESVTAAYGNFAGGFSVAVGDVTGDGKNDVVTGAGPGGGPHVIVWSYNQTQNTFDPVSGFYAYDPRFSGGVNVAVGQFDSRFTPEIVTGPGPGGGPDVRRLSADGTIRASFYAYDARFGGGVSVATFPDANGLGKIVTGAGPGGGPHVKVFTGNGMITLAGWYAYDPAFTGGVSVAAGTVDGAYQIVTGAGAGGGPHIRVFNLDGFVHNGGWYAFEQCCSAGPGVRVAVSP
ncbi:MAG: trimeric autotransporter adhesin, partial [Actinomycetota bacterium]